MTHDRQPRRNFRADERGATAVEYGLIVACIMLAVIAGVGTAGTNIGGSFNKISNALSKS